MCIGHMCVSNGIAEQRVDQRVYECMYVCVCLSVIYNAAVKSKTKREEIKYGVSGQYFGTVV